MNGPDPDVQEHWPPDEFLDDGQSLDHRDDPRSPDGPSVDDFFSPGGLLSRCLTAWEDRPGQWEMAKAVDRALASRRNLIVEAGTGTGKTLAYLVPLLLTGKRTVVSTATKNLQDQLYLKDRPLVAKLLGDLGGAVRVVQMKGRNNYLCLEKLEAEESKPRLVGLEDLKEFAVIRDWAKTTRSGDRAEIPDLPSNSRIWPRMDARREACTGRECRLFEDCFLTRMQRRARMADLIIVNHHLFFADLAMADDDFGAIIPPHDAVVFDEAHQIENVCTTFFGLRISSAEVEALVRDAQDAAPKGQFGSVALDGLIKGLRAASTRFFGIFSAYQTHTLLENRTAIREGHGGAYTGLVQAIDGLRANLVKFATKEDGAQRLLTAATQLRTTLRAVMGESDPDVQEDAPGNMAVEGVVEDNSRDYVYWVEKRGEGVILHATPVDVSSILRQSLFERDRSAILTSATLAVAGKFDFVRSRLGMSSGDELAVEGHFDFRRQTLLYIPSRMPAPQSETYTERAVEEIVALLEASRGRAFVLCTSLRQMENLYREASGRVGYPCLKQGQGSHATLLDRFRRTDHCVLFATMSFWQGVDVPGEQLSCVIIDKLPFAVPSDPIVGARTKRIRNEGGNPFMDYQVPSAAITLKQGFGRLVRSSSDRGVLAILDRRIVTKRYGRTFLKSLPSYTRTDRLEDVEAFFNQ